MKGRGPIFCVRGGEGVQSSAQVNSRHSDHRRSFSYTGYEKSTGLLPGAHIAIISDARTLARAGNQSDGGRRNFIKSKGILVAQVQFQSRSSMTG